MQTLISLQLDNNILILDQDTGEVNNYTAEIVGETYGRIQIDSFQVTQVEGKICRTENSNFTSSCTFVLPGMYLSINQII